ncbi:MAG: ATP synthase F1 subunit delta [Dehalococcoidia bacterium]
MRKGASARRHAQAVFQIALERDELEKWQEDLDALASAIGDPQLKAVLESPRVRLDDKLELVRRQLSEASPLALNLAGLLVTKGRVSIAPGMAVEFRRLVNAHRGLETVEVTTAVPLDDPIKDHISTRLARATGKEIALSTSISHQIIGGLVVKIGDELLDGSTRAKLVEMRKVLAEQQA